MEFNSGFKGLTSAGT